MCWGKFKMEENCRIYPSAGCLFRLQVTTIGLGGAYCLLIHKSLFYYFCAHLFTVIHLLLSLQKISSTSANQANLIIT